MPNDPIRSINRATEEVLGTDASHSGEDAIRHAGRSPYGLGSDLRTSDIENAKQPARRINEGQVFINGMVASDLRLPFGGIKRSGYGRELSELGLREFVNIQIVWNGPSLTR
jgi:succinate-semialdehyde dehydrogenase / glutarate-semialdehyde dehydrogenase